MLRFAPASELLLFRQNAVFRHSSVLPQAAAQAAAKLATPVASMSASAISCKKPPGPCPAGTYWWSGSYFCALCSKQSRYDHNLGNCCSGSCEPDPHVSKFHKTALDLWNTQHAHAAAAASSAQALDTFIVINQPSVCSLHLCSSCSASSHRPACVLLSTPLSSEAHAMP
jgi:hypothetical protein